MSDSLQPHGLYSPWNSPGQNTGVGSLSLLQGIFPTQESNQGLLHCRRILYKLSYQWSPYIKWGRGNITRVERAGKTTLILKTKWKKSLIEWGRQSRFQETNSICFYKGFCRMWIIQCGHHGLRGSDRVWRNWHELKPLDLLQEISVKGGIAFNYFLMAELFLWMWQCTKTRQCQGPVYNRN